MDKINQSKDFSILILAAGIGSRFNKSNFNLPKSLIKINRKPLLEIILKNLKIRGYEDINMILGYKYSTITNFLNQKKNLPKIEYKVIRNYSVYGHGYSLYKFKDLWLKKKKNVIMLHADLYYDWKYFDDIVSNMHKNIIGMTNYKFKQSDSKTLAISLDDSFKIKSIGYKKDLKKPNGQVVCINKFSSDMMKKIFIYMNKYYMSKSNKKNSWEFVFNNFIKETNASFYSNNSKPYPWFNINTIDDLKSAETYDLS